MGFKIISSIFGCVGFPSSTQPTAIGDGRSHLDLLRELYQEVEDKIEGIE